MPPYTCSDSYCLQPKERASHLDTVAAASSGFLHSCTWVPHTCQSPKHNKVTQLCVDFLLCTGYLSPVLKHMSSDCVEHISQFFPKSGVTALCVIPWVSLKEERALFHSTLGPVEALNVQWVCSVAASRSAFQTVGIHSRHRECTGRLLRVQPCCKHSRSFVTSSAVSLTLVLTQEASESVQNLFPFPYLCTRCHALLLYPPLAFNAAAS